MSYRSMFVDPIVAAQREVLRTTGKLPVIAIELPREIYGVIAAECGHDVIFSAAPPSIVVGDKVTINCAKEPPYPMFLTPGS